MKISSTSRMAGLTSASGTTGATNLDYEILDRLAAAALVSLGFDENGNPQANNPGWCAAALGLPIFPHDLEGLRAASNGHIAITDGRVMFIDAQFLRTAMETPRDYEPLLEKLQAAYLAAAQAAVGLPASAGAAVVSTPAMLDLMRSNLPDPDASIQAAGYGLSFNPLAQALARAKSITIPTHASPSATVLGSAIGSSPEWDKVLAAAPPPVALEGDKPSLVGGIYALDWLLSPAFIGKARTYWSSTPIDRAPLNDQVIDNILDIPATQQAALVAAFWHATNPTKEQSTGLAAVSEMSTGLVGASNVDYDLREAIVCGMSFNRPGVFNADIAILASELADQADTPKTKSPRR